eukprot:CAMPEP_0184493088 /NCGR_PEP_ID=MMETSP0113_2-20130426/25071_1 /TAXON_ID=91329 /ORGANISM="Norrisiella sphaerica, Strain BC52" /LENGTH=376 /DNA_ID=CAMNT_0026878217 /DNA_START=157 /DNA_END=1287 /DNA_ORIENTATION=-
MSSPASSGNEDQGERDSSKNGDQSASDRENQGDSMDPVPIETQLPPKPIAGKILILGTGGSGKSTLFRQMIEIFDSSKDSSSNAHFWKQVIQCNVFTYMKVLIELCDKDEDPQNHLPVELSHAKQLVQEFKAFASSNKMEREHVDAIQALWKSPLIQKKHASEMKRDDHAPFHHNVPDFMKDIPRNLSPDTVPSVQDMLKCRLKTCGIHQQEIEIGEDKFKIYDVGGMRSERKKWICCFDNVDAVIFTVALSDYNQTLYEDNATNRLKESLKLWHQISKTGSLKAQAQFVILFTKADMLQKKLESGTSEVPLSDCPLFANHPKAKDKLSCDDAKQLFEDMFTEDQSGLPLSVHHVNLLNPLKVKEIILDLKKKILQ